ncbi:MAG: hypothetical protein ABL958_15140, partial [Bdellovibrionia bacterium]
AMAEATETVGPITAAAEAADIKAATAADTIAATIVPEMTKIESINSSTGTWPTKKSHPKHSNKIKAYPKTVRKAYLLKHRKNS